jgi:methylmalonyl-CoA/ethylmalonyl-CoA epimerase
MFKQLDHLAIVVRDTDEALSFYHDTLELPVLFSEVLEEQSVRLTHLDLGNVHLQLVQPLTAEHPLSRHLQERGEGLHHLCFKVPSVAQAIAALPARGLPSRDLQPRRGPRGRQAAFLDPTATRGVLIEITSKAIDALP